MQTKGIDATLIILFIAILLISPFANVAFAQNATNTTSTTFPNLPFNLSGIYPFLISVNPVLLIILGVVLLIFSKLAKFVGIVLIIIAILHFLFLFLKI